MSFGLVKKQNCVDSFFVYILTGDISKDIAGNVETRFDTSNYELNRPLSKWKNKKINSVM